MPTINTKPLTKRDTLAADFGKTIYPHLVPEAKPLQNVVQRSELTDTVYTPVLKAKAFTASGSPFSTQNSRFVHFTDMRALFSIINQGKIRLYNLNNLNDPGEMINHLPDIVSRRYTEAQLAEKKAHHFVLSMTNASILEDRHHNALNMWRLYGRDGWGVAVELEVNDLENCIDYALGKVCYTEPSYKDLDKQVKDFENRHEVELRLTHAGFQAASLIKSPSYKIEDEVRLLHWTRHIHTSELQSPDLLYWQEARRDNKPVLYHELPVDDRMSAQMKFDSVPKLRIRRIQLGFRYASDFQYRQSQLNSMYHWLWQFGYLSSDERPEIVLSDLVGQYE